MQRSIEKEYSFIVNNGDKITFPEHIFDFSITKKRKINILDFNYENTQEHDKFKNAGIRVRKITDKNHENIELTYKQYLGTKNGMNQFLEITEKIPNFVGNIFLFEQLDNLNLTKKFKKILLDMNKSCIIQQGIRIENTRNLYYYTYGNCVLEVADEKIKYLLGNRICKEKMLEIEIISNLYDAKKVGEFVNYFLERYKLTIPLEGKSERGKKYLSN